MTQSMEPGPGGADEAVESDVSCRKCGYNLRGLTMAGRCPECGTAVGLSVRGDFLRYSDPQWVDTLRRGTGLILWGVTAAIAGSFIVILLAIATSIVDANIAFLPVIVIAYLLIVTGSWFLTAPDPSGVGEDKYGTSRKIIRISLIVGILNFVLSQGGSRLSVPPDALLLLQLIGAAAGIVGVVGVFAQLNYLGKIALRIPDESIARRARFLMYAIGIGYGIIIVGSLLALLLGGSAGGALAIFACVLGIDALALLIFGLMYLRLLHRLKTGFKKATDEARHTWAAGAA